MKNTITVLGLDPSLRNTGWAVSEIDLQTCSIVQVLEWGTLVTAPTKVKSMRRNSDDLARARSIIAELRGVIDKYNIKVGASEIPSGAQSARAALSFGITVGIVAALPIPIIEVMPSETKMATHGTKTADKEDIVRWVLANTEEHPIKWPVGRQPNDWQIEYDGGYIKLGVEHQADAVAVTHAAVKSEQFRQLAGIMNSLI